MLSRRLFFRAGPGAALAASSAAKALASEAATLSGATVVRDSMSGVPSASGLDRNRSLLAVLKKLGGRLPNWKRRQIRENARYGRVLDADIATMRSWSLGAKFRAQFDRNEHRMIRETLEAPMLDIERETWLQSIGLDWW